MGGMRTIRWRMPAIVFPITGAYSDEEAAPLLCAGLIGYRSLRMAGSWQGLGHLRVWGGGPYCGADRCP